MAGVKEPKGDNDRNRCLDDQGARSALTRLREACRISEPEHLYPAVTLILPTGARAQGAPGLQRGDIGFEVGTVNFRRTKIGNVRTVGFADVVAELLKPHRGVGKALVFPGPMPADRDAPLKPADTRSA
jgi:integrase